MNGTNPHSGRNQKSGLNTKCKLCNKHLCTRSSVHDFFSVGRKNIRHLGGIERRTGNGRVVTIATTTAAAEEVTVAANIPEEIQELGGLMILMEYNHQQVHR